MLRKRAWPWLLAVLFVAVLFLGVLPTRTWLAQRQEIEAQEQRIQVLRAENDRLEERIERLQTPEEIERLARAEYNMVRPGEEAYAMLPAPEAPEPEPEAEAHPVEEREERSLFDKITAVITFWD